MNDRTYSLGLYEKALPGRLSWPERFSRAKEAGYEFIEISIDETDERLNRLHWNREERRRFIRDIEESGLYLPTMCLSGHRRFPLGSSDDRLRIHGMEIMTEAIEFASQTGIRIIQLAGYDSAPDEPSTARTMENYLNNLEKSLVLASRKGVILAMENIGVEFTGSIARVMEIVRRFNSPYLQAYPDPGNSLAMGNDPEIDFPAAKGHMAALHIKDTRPGIIRRIPFGEGTVDFVKIFDLIKRSGFSGPMVIELWADDREDTREEITQAAEFVRSMMA